MPNSYTDDFKRQIAQLRENGRTITDITREYGLPKSSVSTWHKQYRTSGSFKQSDKLSGEEKELKQLRKENRQLRMEVDILKQAALIMGRKAE
jgi:transposase